MKGSTGDRRAIRFCGARGRLIGMDQMIEFDSGDGHTVLVPLSVAARAVGSSIQGDAYLVDLKDGTRVEVRLHRPGAALTEGA